jgi:predicted amidohydrolase
MGPAPSYGRLRTMRQPNRPKAGPFRVAVAQIHPKKADYPANLAQIGEVIAQAAKLDPPADIVVFPETVATGYFLEGGVYEQAVPAEQFFKDLQEQTVQRGLTRAVDVVAGFYELADGIAYNAALYAQLDPDGGRIVHRHRKFFLPTYGVFDEGRFVRRGSRFEAFQTRFLPSAVLICEDIWHSISATLVALHGAQAIFCIAASPGRGFAGDQIGNQARYRQLLVSVAEEHSVFIFQSSLVGFEGGKGLIGGSMIVSPFGEVIAEAPTAQDAILVCDCHPDDVEVARANSPLLADLRGALGDVVEEMDRLKEEE